MTDMVYVTADTHFGHPGALRWRTKFATVDEMDEAIITAWNAVVPLNAQVWHVGDFAWHNVDHEAYLGELNGHVNLCLGNHDSRLKNGPGFVSIQKVKYLRWNGQRFWLSHYAHRMWMGSERGTFHLYGHNHGDSGWIGHPNIGQYRALPDGRFGRSMDVGVDANPLRGWGPLPLADVVSLLEDQPLIYRHDPREKVDEL